MSTEVAIVRVQYRHLSVVDVHAAVHHQQVGGTAGIAICVGAVSFADGDLKSRL